MVPLRLRFDHQMCRQGPLDADHTPPCHRCAITRHHTAHTARPAPLQILGDVAVGHHAARRNAVDDFEHRCRELLVGVAQGCVNPGRQLISGMHGGGGGGGGPGGLPEIITGLVDGEFGSKWNVWHRDRSQPATGVIPDAGHQI